MSHRNFPPLKFHGNSRTMNLNELLLANIHSSSYFKTQLLEMNSFNEIVDEIYYKVNHLEPWEPGSNVMKRTYKVYRGVGGSGIPSTAFCLLYKLYTLKPTLKQVVKLILHEDSPYIRALGFLFLRFTQPPDRLWSWFKYFVFEEDTLYLKSGKRLLLPFGELLQMLLFENDWLSTWMPRIPVAVMRSIKESFEEEAKRS